MVPSIPVDTPLAPPLPPSLLPPPQPTFHYRAYATCLVYSFRVSCWDLDKYQVGKIGVCAFFFFSSSPPGNGAKSNHFFFRMHPSYCRGFYPPALLSLFHLPSIVDTPSSCKSRFVPLQSFLNAKHILSRYQPVMPNFSAFTGTPKKRKKKEKITPKLPRGKKKKYAL